MTNKILLWKLKTALYFSDLISLKIQKLIYISKFDFFFSKFKKTYLYFQICFPLNTKTDLYFLDLIFFNPKLICIFQIWFKKKKTQNWSVFSINTYLIFFEKIFFVTKLQILKFKRRCRDRGPNYILGLRLYPRTWGDLRTNK